MKTKIDKKDFIDYIFKYCEKCELNGSFYCHLQCPVYHSVYYVDSLAEPTEFNPEEAPNVEEEE